LLTCKEFLEDLNDYLDEAVGPEVRARLEQHARECPDCYVVVDTTKKTIKIIKGQQPSCLPCEVKERLMAALAKKMAAFRKA
jgi:hypothetical protein